MSLVKYAKYLRYSRAHGDKEPDSIKNQKKIIDEFVNRKIKEGENWTLHDVYIDIDYSGANFNRPGFLRMKKDILDGEIDIVVSKDISRFGRNIATEVYFSEIFPKYGAMFIGVTDNINSGDDNNILERQIRSVMNENYCRDISNKVRSSFYALMAEGKFIGSTEPYGFLRASDDRHKLIIDESVRPVILRIVELYLQGNGFSSVARILNDANNSPLTPTEHKKQRGSNYKNKKVTRNLWSTSTIRKILTDPLYNGTLTQRKYEKINFKLKKKKKNPDEKVIKVENAVEKIIDDETWKLIQKRIKARSKKVNNINNPNKTSPYNIYSGLLYCKDCGSKMAYRSDRDVYMCGIYARYGKKYCSNHHIKTEKINGPVLKQLKILNKLTIEINKLLSGIKQKNYEKNGQNMIRLKVDKYQDRLKTIKSSLKVLREEFAIGAVTENEYKATRQEYVKEKAQIEKELKKLFNISRQKALILENWEEREQDLEKVYKDYFEIKTLDRELVIKLIDQIIIGEGERVEEIVFNVTSPF